MRPDAGPGMQSFCSRAEMIEGSRVELQPFCSRAELIAGMRPEMCAPVARIPDETMKQLSVKYLFLDN